MSLQLAKIRSEADVNSEEQRDGRCSDQSANSGGGASTRGKSEPSVTELLRAHPQRQDELYEAVYSHLKAIAQNRISGESNREMHATVLVNEAYLKLARQNSAWRDRRHFYGVAAEAMRRILIDDARMRKRAKRGGQMVRQPLSAVFLPGNEDWGPDLVELDEALNALESYSAEHSELVRLKFFSGLTFPECSEVLNVSLSTVERRWRFARAWLQSKMGKKVEGDEA